jgi:carboxyl-terminal processing protease
MNFLFWILLILGSTAEAKAPELSPRDVKNKIEEVLKAHASYKKFSAELIDRTFQNFLEEIDPSKCYFLAGEISPWTHPSETLLHTTLEEFNKGDYTTFHQIYSLLEPAVERRNRIEAKIANHELPKDVNSDEFKETSYAETEEDLFLRLLRIKSLQAEAATKLNEDTCDLFLQRIQKRRLNQESELLNDPPEERARLVLSYLLKSAACSLDSHTNYFTPSEASQFMIQVQQRLFGIGAQLKDTMNGFSVMRILENSPASQSKLKVNDRIIAVDQEPVVGMDIVEAVDLIRGGKGTPVMLTILRENNVGEEKSMEKHEVELVRNEVVLEESRLESTTEPFGDGVIAHIKLFSFYQDQNYSSTSDLRKAIDTIKKNHKLQGVVLDLRNNSGGLLPQAVTVTGLFIHKGIVISIKDSSGKLQHLREIEGRPVWDGPLTVLVNRASASAAEIVAQTLQDYGRAIVVGDDHTFGKGSFQTFTLDPISNPKVNPKGEYKVTRGRYYTVSGKSPQLVGVLPDIVVPGILSSLDIGEKFSKFPLPNDSIDPHFEDDLSDISPLHRLQLGPMYKYNLQTKLTTWPAFLETLSSNSQQRIESNKNYQNFLTKLEKQNFDSDPIDLFGQSDLQLTEAFNIMKDLIFLHQQPSDLKIAS